MKSIYLILILFVTLAAGTMQVQEPKELPEGLFCNPKGVVGKNGLVIDPAHPCHCEHMTYSKDCEGYVQENGKCTQRCHKDHCHCPVKCEPVETSPD